jgi:dTDP-4-dehydrorhamnose reductase
MNILLIGGPGSLMNQFLNKLHKEGHRIFLLTGSRYDQTEYKHVFEKYNFTYDCNCLNEIFESIDPDVIVFFGAYDTNFQWHDEQKDAVYFTTSLINILMAFTRRTSCKLIFLSSQAVFNGEYPEDITEEEVSTPSGFRSMAIAQCEDMCENYQVNRHLNIVILRLQNLYTIPISRRDVRDICSQMCYDAIEKEKISVNADHVFSMLFESDAVEFVYQFIRNRNQDHGLYHLASDEVISELDLAEKIKQEVGGDIELDVSRNGTRRVLSSQRFREEFDGRVFGRTDDTVPKIVKYMKRHREDYKKEKQESVRLKDVLLGKTGWFLSILIPVLENVVCCLLFSFLRQNFGDTSYFAYIDFYLLYVLIFAIIYGQRQATLSSVLAMIGFCYQETGSAQTMFQLLLDPGIYIWVVELFGLGLFVGRLRDLNRKQIFEREEESSFLTGQLNDIHDINDSNVRVKEALTSQIINQNDSIGKIYNITSTLDAYMPEEVLFYAASMLSTILQSEDVAIYTISNGSFARLFSSTSSRARQMGVSIRYTEMGRLSEAILSKKVFINRELEEGYPLMANAIYSEDEIQMIIMVWGIPWERMTLGMANVLIVVSDLIQNAVIRANRYLTALESERYLKGMKVLEPSAFIPLVHAYTEAKRKGLTESSLLKIYVPQEQFEKASSVLNGKLRQSDYLGVSDKNELYALLANTDDQAAQIVIERFREAGYESELTEEI